MNKQEIVDFLNQPENRMLGREVIDEHLAHCGSVAFFWGIDDVRSVKDGKNLTDEECFLILDNIRRHHDASIGVNWDVISCYVSDYVSDEDYENDKRDEKAELFYFIDLDERGEFRASLRNQDDDTLLEINDEIFVDGFMKHKEDTDGLLKYVQSLGYITTKITKGN